MVSTSTFHVTCSAASSGSSVTATNQGELLVNRTSIDFAVQHNVPNITGLFLGETLLRDSISSNPLTLTVDTEADGFELTFLLSEMADCWFTVHNITVTQLILPSMVSTSTFHVTCSAASSGTSVTATNQGELLVNRTSIDFAVQHNVPNITGLFLGETLLRDSISSNPLTLTVDTEADGFELRFHNMSIEAVCDAATGSLTCIAPAQLDALGLVATPQSIDAAVSPNGQYWLEHLFKFSYLSAKACHRDMSVTQRRAQVLRCRKSLQATHP